MKIIRIVERKEVVLYLEKRNLLRQYKKAKNFLLAGGFYLTDFKKRKPKEDGIWYFRINRQFRALAYLDNDILVVFDINNHQ
ncbi:hypothetical protein KAI52_00965 [Candidatus Parcubacteria bacterium]|nr:hypothetical protein [Candidatus Parcubacteria bacterium]